MKCLIATEPDDIHAILVKLALERLGHSVRLLFTADQPTKLKNSVYIDNSKYQWKSTDRYETYSDNNYDIVWWRRARKPFLPPDSTHPDDHKFALRENALFYESFTYNLAPNAWWINPKDSAIRANSKLLQLKVASQCGLTIPTTLCSNDPKDIRYFLLKNETNGVIYKPLCSNFWFENKHVKISYTTKINFLDLPTNKLLQITPGIFQKEIKKSYELRIACFGDYLVAAKLNSQVHLEGQVDWRIIPENKLSIEPYSLPEELACKIRIFMHEMGLVFGSIDMVVDKKGDYIFLEVNEQGQFLWIEELNPSFKLLDLFINFMLSKSVNFKNNTITHEHAIADYKNQVSYVLSQHMERHVDLNRANAQLI